MKQILDVRRELHWRVAMDTLDIFVQAEGHGCTELLQLTEQDTCEALVAAMRSRGLCCSADMFLFIEDDRREGSDDRVFAVTEDVLTAGVKQLGIHAGSQVHLHTFRSLEVAVNYRAATRKRQFLPSRSAGTVLRWALDTFHIDAVEGTEFGLFVCGDSGEAVDDDVHIGRLARGVDRVCFDMGPKHRVQG